VCGVGTLAVLLTACGPEVVTPPPILTPAPEATAPSPLDSPLTQTDATPGNPLIVHVGAGTFTVEVADDTAERAAGLSGRDFLAQDSGMWFAYLDSGPRSFWMRGMRFPIDIVWIDSSMKVVGITKNAPVPLPDALTNDLPHYTHRGPIMYVLEINAGLAHDWNIEVGTLVALGEK
jgi:uncharacterized membrane protein (UPF0127 family)